MKISEIYQIAKNWQSLDDALEEGWKKREKLGLYNPVQLYMGIEQARKRYESIKRDENELNKFVRNVGLVSGIKSNSFFPNSVVEDLIMEISYIAEMALEDKNGRIAFIFSRYLASSEKLGYIKRLEELAKENKEVEEEIRELSTKFKLTKDLIYGSSLTRDFQEGIEKDGTVGKKEFDSPRTRNNFDEENWQRYIW